MLIEKNDLIFIKDRFLLVKNINLDCEYQILIKFDTIINQNKLEHLKIKYVEEGSVMYNKILDFTKYKNYIAPLEIIREIRIKEILNININE